MAKRPVRRYEPKPKPKPAPSRAREREAATERREAGRAAAPPAKPAAAKIPPFRGAGKFGGTVPAYPAPAAAVPLARSTLPAWGGGKFGGLAPYAQTQEIGTGPFFTGTMYNPPVNVPWGGGKFGAIPGWAAAAQARRLPPYQILYSRTGESESTMRNLAAPPRVVRQGTMTKARAPVTARPYVQLERPAPSGEPMADYGLGAEPFYPYPDYGGGYPETGGGYGGGYGDGGGGGGASREVPPWYYGLVSWRF